MEITCQAYLSMVWQTLISNAKQIYSYLLLTSIIKILTMGQNSSSRQIYLTIEAGQTQSLQLFDFTSPENRVIVNQLITNNTIISQDGDNIIYNQKGGDYQPLYQLHINHQHIQLQTAPTNNKRLWRVLKPGEVYPLQCGNYVKLGKVKLRLKQIVQQQKQEKDLTSRDIQSKSMYQQLIDVKSVSEKSFISHQQKVCRICFETTTTLNNPLVSLCKCSGTVKYIHFECLKDWLSKNVAKRQHNNTLFYSYQQPKCQLCQKYYQAQFNYQGRRFSLLDMENAPNPPYAIFEGNDFQDQNKRFSVFLIGLGEQQITIGRNSNSNVVMKQISVSRSHCSLFYRNNRLFVKDKGSKFGTLIRVQNQLEFNPNEGLCLQLESKLITIREKTRLNCCCAEADSILLKITKNNFSNDYFQDEG